VFSAGQGEGGSGLKSDKKEEKMDHKKQVKALFAAESRGDVEAIVELMAEDAVLLMGCLRIEDPKAKVRYEGKQEIRDLYSEQVKARGNFSIEAVNYIQEGDMVAAEWIVKRGQDGTDVRRGVDLFRFRDDKIVHGVVYVDLASLPGFRS